MTVLEQVSASNIRSLSENLDEVRATLIELEQEFDFTKDADGELETITFYPNCKYDFNRGVTVKSLVLDRNLDYIH